MKQELQSLRSEFMLLESDLALRLELNSELQLQVQDLERKVQTAEEAAHTAAHKLSVALEEKKDAADQVSRRSRSLLHLFQH